MHYINDGHFTSCMLPPSPAHSPDSSQTIRISGEHVIDNPMVVRGNVAGGSDRPVTTATRAPPKPSPVPAAEQEPPVAPNSCLEVICERIAAARFDPELSRFIASSVRDSSLRTYGSAWGRLGLNGVRPMTWTNFLSQSRY